MFRTNLQLKGGLGRYAVWLFRVAVWR